MKECEELINSRLIQVRFLAKSSMFESTDFGSVMIDDVGCGVTFVYSG